MTRPSAILPGTDYVDRRSGHTWQATRNTTGGWDYICLSAPHPRIITVEELRASKRVRLVPIVPLPEDTRNALAADLHAYGGQAASVLVACLQAAYSTVETDTMVTSWGVEQDMLLPVLAGRPGSWETAACKRLLEETRPQWRQLAALFTRAGLSADRLAQTIYEWMTHPGRHIAVPEALGAVFSRVVALAGSWEAACDPQEPCARWLSDHARPWLAGMASDA